MKKYIAILFAALYVSFVGGIMWTDLHSNAEPVISLSTEEQKSSSEESAEGNLHMLAAARHHLVTDAKAKIPRPCNVAIDTRNNLQETGARQPEQLSTLTSYNKVPVIIKICVFRL